jgi:hypothetical protein
VQIRLIAVDLPIDSAELLTMPFRRRHSDGKFRPGRFNDGSFGVYYSALEEETSIEEIRFHRGKDIKSALSALQQHSSSPRPQAGWYYSVFQAQYVGLTVDLTSCDQEFPQLLADEQHGYPFCRQLGRQAHTNGRDGFRTPSAQRRGGVCTPVFTESALRDPAIRYRGRFILDATELRFERIA